MFTAACSSITIETITNTAVAYIGTNGVVTNLLTLIKLLYTLIDICKEGKKISTCRWFKIVSYYSSLTITIKSVGIKAIASIAGASVTTNSVVTILSTAISSFSTLINI